VKHLNPRAALRKRLDEGMPRSDIPSYKRAWNKTGKQLKRSRNGH
jgi:hypothetical protein